MYYDFMMILLAFKHIFDYQMKTDTEVDISLLQDLFIVASQINDIIAT